VKIPIKNLGAKFSMNDTSKERWNSLAIHPIGHSTMAWDAVPKILDVKCTLEARCKESSERGNQ